MAAAAPSLPDLPLEVLETIGSHLSLAQRVLLTSCCRALWARADVLSSAALWGDLSLGQRHPSPAAKQAALEAWLARRRAGLRRLQLQCWYGQQLRPPLLETLVCDGLVELQLRHLHKEECVEPLVALLPRAAGLTRLALSACGVKSLPVQLGALPNLRDLALDNNFCMGVEGCFRALSRLVTLTRLDLSYCCLAVLPKELGELTALAALELKYNGRLGQEGGRAWEPLQQLLSLTRLGLADCNLACLPEQLSGLVRLADLDIGSNWALGEGGEEALEPLSSLTALTRLEAPACGLNSVPAQLAVSGQRLRHLVLSGNSNTYQLSLTALQHLSALTSLEYCDFSCWALPGVPPQLACLPSLRELDMSYIADLGAGADEAFQPLEWMPSLTRLSLNCCSLRSLPPQLSALTALLELHAFRNWHLEGAADAEFWPLQHLTSLTLLDLKCCGLKRVPPQVGALRALVHLNLSGNWVELEGGCDPFQLLANLSCLTAISLESCGLHSVPRQLALLQCTLAVLDLGHNGELGTGGPEALHTLGSLSELTRLSLRACGLSHVPQELASLQKLAALDLGQLHIQLPSLKEQLAAAGAGGRRASSALRRLAALPRLLLSALRSQRSGGVDLDAFPADATFQPLLGLTSLTLLDLSSTHLCGVPRQLRPLTAVGMRVLFSELMPVVCGGSTLWGGP